MFIHAIKFEVADAQAVRDMFDFWHRTVAPVAVGWLGSTAGITARGRFVRVARWESEEAHRACAQRPEQKAFDERSMKMLGAAPESVPCPAVDVFLRGGSEDAGFVQVIFGRVTEEDRARHVHRRLEGPFGRHRPDVIGGTIGWVGDGGFVETMYFTSESEAREAERKKLPPDLNVLEGEFAALIAGDMEFNDLPEPWLASPPPALR